MKAKRHHDRVVSEDGPLEYAYYLSRRRRTLGIVVRHDLSVTVRVPAGTPLEVIRRFVLSRSAWIRRALQRFEASSGGRPPGSIPDTVAYLGRRYTIHLVPADRQGAALEGDALVVRCPDISCRDTISRLLDAWHQKQAVAVFAERAVVCHRLMQGEGIPLPPLRVRPMQSRWGSYSYRTGRISLNRHLVRFGIECIDYVIVHELCHLLIRHHGPLFWQLVARYVPDHLRLRRQLRGC